MSIFTAHRILIGLAVVFFAWFGVGRGLRFVSDGGLASAIVALLSVVAAIGLAVYWRTIPRR